MQPSKKRVDVASLKRRIAELEGSWVAGEWTVAGKHYEVRVGGAVNTASRKPKKKLRRRKDGR